jgi:hypothetical protein
MKLSRSLPPRAALPALAALAAFGAYVQTVTYDFTLDDRHLIVLNERLSSWRDLAHYFTEAHVWQEGYAAFFRPMVYASLMLNHFVSAAAPWSYHLLNVLLHTLATLLVYALARMVAERSASRLSHWPFIAALLFAIHPTHTEAVANVAGRADVMMTCWILVGVLLAARAYRGSIPAAAGVCLCALCAPLTKETGFLLIPLLLVWDWTCNRYSAVDWRLRIRTWLAGAAGTVTAGAMYIAAHATATTSFQTAFLDNPAAYAPPVARLTTGIYLTGKAIMLMCLPYPLSADYSYAQIVPVTTLLTPVTAIGITAVVALLAWSWRLPPTPGRKVTECGVLWFLVAYVPSSNLFFPIGTIFGERLLYLASVGACLAGGYGVAYLWSRPNRPLRTVGLPLVLAALLLCAWTIARNTQWRDQSSVRQAMLRTAPRSAKAHFSAARELAGAHRPREALGAIRTALSIHGMYPEAHALHGAVLIELRDYTNAWKAAARALQLNPHVAEAHYYLGLVARQWGRTNEAAQHFATARRLRPEMFGGSETLDVRLETGDL